ncbi:hypothetical protein BMR10_17520, partial [Methylococcaceae bacterium CS4]
DETMLAKALLKNIYKILPQSDLASVADFMAKVELDKKQFIWQYYRQNKVTIRRNLRRLFLTLEFEIDKAHFELANQIIAGSRYFCESLFWASQPKQAAKT